MLAVFGGKTDQVVSLLAAGAEPLAAVSHSDMVHTAVSLARNEPILGWRYTHSPQVEAVLKASLKWSPDSAYLFPARFKHGVLHILYLAALLSHSDDATLPILETDLWFIVISHIPRSWGMGFKRPCVDGSTTQVKRVKSD